MVERIRPHLSGCHIYMVIYDSWIQIDGFGPINSGHKGLIEFGVSYSFSNQEFDLISQ